MGNQRNSLTVAVSPDPDEIRMVAADVAALAALLGKAAELAEKISACAIDLKVEVVRPQQQSGSRTSGKLGSHRA